MEKGTENEKGICLFPYFASTMYLHYCYFTRRPGREQKGSVKYIADGWLLLHKDSTLFGGIIITITPHRK